jgi:hypothetical protein
MGMVPILVISPLTVTRPDDPVLEPPLPVARVNAEAANTGGNADEGYSSSQGHTQPEQDPDLAELQQSANGSESTHQVNLFA